MIFLNAGDFYHGSIWYTHFKWKIVAQFAEMLNFTAMAPGSHEFDDGVEGFEPFLANITFPVVCSNLDISEAPESLMSIEPWVAFEMEGIKIAIVGYTTPETQVNNRILRVIF